MLPIGIVLSLDMAMSEEEKGGKDDSLFYTMLLLGLLREDISFISFLPGIGLSFPSLSFGHLWPLSTWRCRYLYNKSVRLAKKSQWARSYLYLGRALHVLIDMACPVHAHPVWHYLHDPYERYVDYHAEYLKLNPVSATGIDVKRDSIASFVRRLAAEARQEHADRTQSPWGRLTKRAGLRRPLNHATIAPQAKRLIPLAAGFVRDFLTRYRIDAGKRGDGLPTTNASAPTRIR